MPIDCPGSEGVLTESGATIELEAEIADADVSGPEGDAEGERDGG